MRKWTRSAADVARRRHPDAASRRRPPSTLSGRDLRLDRGRVVHGVVRWHPRVSEVRFPPLRRFKKLRNGGDLKAIVSSIGMLRASCRLSDAGSLRDGRSLRTLALLRKADIWRGGIQADGQRDMPGLWIEQTEGAKFWLRCSTNSQEPRIQTTAIRVMARRYRFRNPQCAESMQQSSSHLALPTHIPTSLPILREEIVRGVNGSRRDAVTHKSI